MLRRSVASVLLVAVLGAPASAQSPEGPPPSRGLFERAMTYYEAGDLARALEELEKAYALDPMPQIAYAMGKIHVERGECAKAIIAYRRFLESKPGPNSTQIATDAIADCQKILLASGEAVPPESRPTPEPLPAKRLPAIAPEPEPDGETATRTRPWYSDTLGDALVAAGTGGLILGGVLALSARTDVSKANQGAAGGITLEEHRQLSDDADRKQLWAGIAAGAGGALIICGVARYLTGDRTETITVMPTGTGSGTGATVRATWRF